MMVSETENFWHDKQGEFQHTWQECIKMFPGIEKWQRHLVYTTAREDGFGQDAAWDKAMSMPGGELPDIVFVWDGISQAEPQLESVK